jgi:hypothetical protein
LLKTTFIFNNFNSPNNIQNPFKTFCYVLDPTLDYILDPTLDPTLDKKKDLTKLIIRSFYNYN